jgi:hypothetical protein
MALLAAPRNMPIQTLQATALKSVETGGTVAILGRLHLSSAPNPHRTTSTDVFPPQMSHTRQPLHSMKSSRTLLGVRRVATLEYGLKFVDSACGRYTVF